MLVFGQERSIENAALAAEPGCDGDSKLASLVEFQGHITTPFGVAGARVKHHKGKSARFRVR
jgi:hypothetical protein